MIGQWLPRRHDAMSDAQVLPLTVADVVNLDLGWRSMFNADDLRRHLRRHPRRSFWIPSTREYVIGGYLRHRQEIGSLIELDARGNHNAALVAALLAACAEDDCPLVIFNDTSELRNQRWYHEMGFELVEEIIVYELHTRPASRPERPARLRFEPIDEATPELLHVDQQAFPFLWWNCPAEFRNYLDQTGVRLHLGRNEHGVAVAYAGITLYQGWGHLDRLAVLPEFQGQGYGLETLSYAVAQVYASGARRVGLSTQAANQRSQVLYERFGFRRVYRTDYSIYGHWLIHDKAERAAVVRTPDRA
jgi:ribosomal-protein-alanine N-acetyltransferase